MNFEYEMVRMDEVFCVTSTNWEDVKITLLVTVRKELADSLVANLKVADTGSYYGYEVETYLVVR